MLHFRQRTEGYYRKMVDFHEQYRYIYIKYRQNKIELTETHQRY